MMERRLLVGMAGVVAAVLCALVLQIVADTRPPLASSVYGSRN